MQPINQALWTEEQDNQLKKLWATKLTSEEIGEIMGKTKNAIVGRANRIVLPPRKKGMLKQRVEKIEERRDLIRGVGDPEKRGNMNYCQYLEGNKFCHEPIDKRQFAFCDHHMKICFREGSALRTKAKPISYQYARER